MPYLSRSSTTLCRPRHSSNVKLCGSTDLQPITNTTKTAQIERNLRSLTIFCFNLGGEEKREQTGVG
jgi:hypothetical protein